MDTSVSVRGDAMPKSAGVGHPSRGHGRPRTAELPDVVEGQIAELCRDLAIEAKRMRRLQEQAGELQRAIRQFGRPLRGALVRRQQLVVEDDAKQ